MFILKIHQKIYEREERPDEPLTIPPVKLHDERDIFVQADQVIAHSWIEPDRQTAVIADFDGSCDDCASFTFGGGEPGVNEPARLIETVAPGPFSTHHWYLASGAWLLGENGRTIERLA